DAESAESFAGRSRRGATTTPRRVPATPPPRSKGSGVPRAVVGIEGRSQIPLEISDAVVRALTADARDARTAQKKIGPELLPARVLNKGLCPCQRARIKFKGKALR